MSPSAQRCARCDSPLGRDVGGGVCTACLLEEALPEAEGYAESATAHDLNADVAMVQRLGPYELLEEVGRGGMGVIYKARQAGLDRIVALKMLLAGEFADAKAKERLMREAKIAARLTHPGIVTIYDVGEHEGRPFFAMEYVPGQNLAQHCRNGLLPLTTAVRYVEHLAQAVHYAHQHGVIHRDLKPANILVTPDDTPKLTDFGLTKSLVDPTQTLESAGSPNFMAPEQADSTLGITGTPTDVFGLGAILYFLLTGRPPVIGETLAETLRQVVEGEPVAPRQLRPAVPRDLETITLKCLEKESARRYGSALEVADELSRWQRHEPILARPATSAERLAKWVRRHPVVSILTLAVILSLIGGLGATSWQWRRARTEAIAAAKATALAKASEVQALRNAYVAELTTASQAARERRWQDVRKILERTKPLPGQEDLRGWEWRYLWQASRLTTAGRIQIGTNAIGSMAILDDGYRVAVGEIEGGFSLWDTRTSRKEYQSPEPINRIRHPSLSGGAPIICRVAVVPGTGILAYTDCRSSTNSWLHLWHVDRHEIIRSIPIPGMPRFLAASPDGTKLACSLQWPEERALIFRVEDGSLLARLEHEPSNYSKCHALAFSADSGAILLDQAPSRCIRLVDITTGMDLRRFPYEQSYPLSVAVSPDGHWLVIGTGFDPNLPRVTVWDMQTGQRRRDLPASSQYAVSFSKDGRRLVTGLSVWRVPEFTLEREFDGISPDNLAASFLGDGDSLLTENGGQILRWRLSSPKPNRSGFSLGARARSLLFLQNESGVLLARADGRVDRSAYPDFHPTMAPELGEGVVSLAQRSDSGEIIVIRNDGSISMHAKETGVETTRFSGTTNTPSGFSYWVQKSEVLVLRTTNERLEVWDLQTRLQVWEASLLPGRELSLPSSDGILWQVHVDGWLAGYDVIQKKVLKVPIEHTGMHRIAISTDGHSMLLTSPDGGRRLVEPRTGRTLDYFSNTEFPAVHGGAIWPNEDRIGFSGLHIVERITGRRLLTLEPDFFFHSDTFISNDGSLVLAGDYEGRCYLWRAPSWDEIRQAEATATSDGW